MTVRRAVLRYHGGKWRLAPWVISHFPEHRIYVEPFAGGASVLMRKPRSYGEVYNDRWSWVVNVFDVLRDATSADELRRRIKLTPFARDEFERCGLEAVASLEDPIERARLAIFRSFAGFGSASMNGIHSTGFRSNSNRSGTTPAQDWGNYPDRISDFTERLRGVVIENRDALTCIRQHDTRLTLHYIDPPYPHSTRNMRRGNAEYVHEMTDDDHRELAKALHELDGMVVLSGYHCDLYDQELYPDWEFVETEALADGARKRVEVLWFNPAAWDARPRHPVQQDLYEVSA